MSIDPAQFARLDEILAAKATCARVVLGAQIVVDAETIDAIRDLVGKAVAAIEECDAATADLKATAAAECRRSAWDGACMFLGLPLSLLIWNWAMYRVRPSDYGGEDGGPNP